MRVIQTDSNQFPFLKFINSGMIVALIVSQNQYACI